MVVVSVVALGFGVAYVVTHLMVRHRGRLQILDHPNERSLHTDPTPRTGGFAIWGGAIAATCVAVAVFGTQNPLPWIGVAASLVGITSLIDDRFQLPVLARLTIQLLAGLLLFLGGIRLVSLELPGAEFVLGWGPSAALTILFVIWMTNLYNFMDGMDGFAGGMGAIGFGALGLLAYIAGDTYFTALSWGIAAAAAGFLALNFPPARIFMGDTGASALGLTAAAFSLWADTKGLIPLWISVLIFSPFIVDATVTLVRRTIRGNKIWIAHKTHYYQRLVQVGWGHRKTVLFEYALMFACSSSAVFAGNQAPGMQWAVIAFWVVVYIVLIWSVDQMDKETAMRSETL